MAIRTGVKALSWLARDWTIGGVLRYQSGQLLQSPFSANNLLSNLARGPANNPALWGGGYTFLNRVPGQPLFLVDPNSHVRSHPATGAESEGVGGTAVWHVRGIRALLQRLSLAAAARRKHGLRASLPHQRKSPARRSGRNSRTSSTACSIRRPPTAHRSASRLRRSPRLPSTATLAGTLSQGFGYVNWVNGGLDAIRRGPAQVGPDRGAVHF